MKTTRTVLADHSSCQPATPSSADLRLISGLRAGVDRSYEELLLRIERIVAPLTAGLNLLVHDTDDLVQNVALKIFRGISNFRGDSALNSWIFRIAVNELHSSCRWLMRHRLREISESMHNGGVRACVDNIRDPAPSPLARFVERQFDQHVAAALSTLAPTCHDALFLRIRGELTYEEIAQKLNIPVSTARSRIFVAKRQLRSLYSLGVARRP